MADQKKAAKAPAMWGGFRIGHPDHAQNLNIRAAALEFGDRLPRSQAEAKAYAEYAREQRLHAAAHHLAGVKAATGAGAMEEAAKHGELYEQHMKALGFNPAAPVPPEVAKLLPQVGAVYKFKGHDNDALNEPAPAAPAEPEPMKKSEEDPREEPQTAPGAKLFVAWEIPLEHRVAPLVASSYSEELKRLNTKLDQATQDCWVKWAQGLGGQMVMVQGSEGIVAIPVKALAQVAKQRDKFKEAMGEPVVGVGVGPSMDKAVRARDLARKQAREAPIFYSPEVDKALKEQAKGGESKLSKALAENQGAGAGFGGFSTGGNAVAPTPPAAEGSEHSEAEAAMAAADTSARPAPAEMTHAAAGLVDQMRSVAAEKTAQARNFGGPDDQKRRDALRQQVAGLLKQIQQQAPMFGQLKVAAPEMYATMMELVQGVIAMARELRPQEMQKSEAPLRKAEGVGPMEALAQAYHQKAGLPYSPPQAVQPVPLEHFQGMAHAYEAAQHNPNDPQVKAAYAALKAETLAQYEHLKQAGYQFHPVSETTGTSHDMHNALSQKQLGVFTGGEEGMPHDHPLLEKLPYADPLGTYNNAFRAVHDVLGHELGRERHVATNPHLATANQDYINQSFEPHGEEHAFRAQASLYSPLARQALVTETRGQNAAFNHGKNASHNLHPVTGKAPIFPEQKATLLPPQFHHQEPHDLQKSEPLAKAVPGGMHWDIRFDHEPHTGHPDAVQEGAHVTLHDSGGKVPGQIVKKHVRALPTGEQIVDAVDVRHEGTGETHTFMRYGPRREWYTIRGQSGATIGPVTPDLMPAVHRYAAAQDRGLNQDASYSASKSALPKGKFLHFDAGMGVPWKMSFDQPIPGEQSTGPRTIQQITADYHARKQMQKAEIPDVSGTPAEELKKDTCDYTAKSTRERCKNPRSRKVGAGYFCHHHADEKAKDDKRAEKELKKALGDIPVGPAGGAAYPAPGMTATHDYSHVLKPEHQAAGYQLSVHHDGGDQLVASLHHGGQMVGSVNANIYPANKNMSVDTSDLSPEHRGKGVGMAMYEGLMAHAKNHMGIRSVVGGDHSTMASAVHQRLSAKHGMNYVPRAIPERVTHASGPNDGKMEPYSYALKAEMPMRKMDEYGVPDENDLMQIHEVDARTGQTNIHPGRVTRVHFRPDEDAYRPEGHAWAFSVRNEGTGEEHLYGRTGHLSEGRPAFGRVTTSDAHDFSSPDRQDIPEHEAPGAVSYLANKESHVGVDANGREYRMGPIHGKHWMLTSKPFSHEMGKAELPMPKAPKEHHVILPPGSVHEGGPGGDPKNVGRVKVQHGDGSSSWIQARAGQVPAVADRHAKPLLGHAAHPLSSRNPTGR